MNFIDDPQIITPINIQPNYDINSNRLNFQLPITNKHPHPIHFYVGNNLNRSPPLLDSASKNKPTFDLSMQIAQSHCLSKSN